MACFLLFLHSEEEFWMYPGHCEVVLWRMNALLHSSEEYWFVFIFIGGSLIVVRLCLLTGSPNPIQFFCCLSHQEAVPHVPSLWVIWGTRQHLFTEFGPFTFWCSLFQIFLLFFHLLVVSSSTGCQNGFFFRSFRCCTWQGFPSAWKGVKTGNTPSVCHSLPECACSGWLSCFYLW